MHEIKMSADELVGALLAISATEPVSILDSCGVGYLGSHLLIAGLEPVKTVEVSNADAGKTLAFLDEEFIKDHACIFTLSYDFGAKLAKIDLGDNPTEPDLFLAAYDVLIIHDYSSNTTRLTGNAKAFADISEKLKRDFSNLRFEISNKPPILSSNFSKSQYLQAIETIQEEIRRGNTYQTNLTQQITAQLSAETTPQIVFSRLRRDHPAPFAAFINRLNSTVVSASPERFFQCASPHVSKGVSHNARITTSPIKGTRRRGKTPAEDELLKTDLLTSQKDRAENTMIVDLLRNDIGRVCEYGTVEVEKLCDLETYPTLYHLVSTVAGTLRENTRFSDIVRALFPCGSVTGAPKISTMRIIDQIENTKRGLSMGAIGVQIPTDTFGMPQRLDLSVAIRTMVFRDNVATFNVGGGITIDSVPENEYEETLTKAAALLYALGVGPETVEQISATGF